MSKDKNRTTSLFFKGLKERATQTDDYFFDISPNVCIACDIHIPDDKFDDNNSIIRLECGHSYCTKCLNRFAKLQIQNKEALQICCPMCTAQLTDQELKQLDPTYSTELESRLLNDMHMISCPNCEQLIHYAYKSSKVTKDAFGIKIRPEVSDFVKKNLIICTTCKKSFCLKCHATPFHDAVTCDEHRLIEQGVVCRFCGLYPAIGCEGLSCAQHVCWHKKCKDTLKDACSHVLKCGHPCCGYIGEKAHFGCPLCDKGLSKCTICEGPCLKGPSVIMKCGHPAHKKCLIDFYKYIDLEGQLHVPHCNFQNTCQSIPYHECVKKEAKKWIEISKKIDEVTAVQIHIQDIQHERKHVLNPKDKDYYKQPDKFANDLFVFFLCEKCHTPYYAGHIGDGEPESSSNDSGKHLCFSCRVVPEAPHDLMDDEIILIDNKTEKEIMSKRSSILDNRIIYLGVRKVYHATTTASGNSIMNDRALKKGKNGMFGPGIYFAATSDIARMKCRHVHHDVDVFVHCNVDFGFALVLEEPHNNLSLEELREYGCNSVMGRSGVGRMWEFVVYDGKRTHPLKMVPLDD